MKLDSLNLDRWSKNLLVSAATLTLIQIGVLILASPKLPPQVPLFYSLPWGESRLVSPVWLWLLPAVSAATVILNLIGSHFLNELVLTRVLSTTAALVTILSFLTLIKVILLGLP